MSMTNAASDYFEQVAGQWDELRTGYFGPAVRETAIAKAYLRPEMVVADIGAGTGFMTAGLAPLVRQVHVVDGSAAMLAVARQNLAQFTNLEYHESVGERLPFADESLDAVFANMYLHHTHEPQTAIREMVRVLRPGGRLVITDMDEHPYAWLKEEMADEWLGFNRQQVLDWYREAGLVNILVTGTGQTCCATPQQTQVVGQQGQEARISVFVAAGTRHLAIQNAVQENYEGLALSGTSCGCSPSAGCCDTALTGSSNDANWVNTYSPDERSAAPSEAAEISLGCGNPTALANLQPGEVVVDIGSGGGLDAFLAADKVGPSGRVIGVDMTPAMLDRARATAERNGITNVEFRQGLAQQLPIADGTADVIISNCVINLTEDKGRVFEEAFRILKPGGRLEVSDVVTNGQMPMEALQDRASWSDCITGALPEQEYLDLIAQAGFTGATVRRSVASGQAYGVDTYSVIVSARKPQANQGDCCADNPAEPCCCGG